MVYNFEEKSYKSTTGNAQRSKTAVCFLNSAGSISPSDDVTWRSGITQIFVENNSVWMRKGKHLDQILLRL